MACLRCSPAKREQPRQSNFAITAWISTFYPGRIVSRQRRTLELSQPKSATNGEHNYIEDTYSQSRRNADYDCPKIWGEGGGVNDRKSQVGCTALTRRPGFGHSFTVAERKSLAELDLNELEWSGSKDPVPYRQQGLAGGTVTRLRVAVRLDLCAQDCHAEPAAGSRWKRSDFGYSCY